MTKVEKNNWIVHGQILNTEVMGNQQPNSKKEKVQRLSLMGVGYKRLVAEVVDILIKG